MLASRKIFSKVAQSRKVFAIWSHLQENTQNHSVNFFYSGWESLPGVLSVRLEPKWNYSPRFIHFYFRKSFVVRPIRGQKNINGHHYFLCHITWDSSSFSTLQIHTKGQEISEWKYEVFALPKYERKNLKNSALNT